MNKIMHPIEPEELMAYLDGELSSGRAKAAAAHLGECKECQDVVTELRSVSQTLKIWEVEPTESATPPAVATALVERGPRPRSVLAGYLLRWRGILGPPWRTVALATICLVVFITLWFQRGESPELSTRPNETVALIAPDSAPTSSSAGGGDRDKLVLDSKSQVTAKARYKHGLRDEDEDDNEPAEKQSTIATGPMIIRTADLTLITKEFDKTRTNLEAILKHHRGYIGELKVGGATGSGRTLTATLRVPADQLDATLAEVKALGRVESENQGGQDVTSQYVDLQARLANARNTEQRLTDLLRNRTGKLSDVLAVEQELDRVRGEIEEMEAERKTMAAQVSFATLNATITEDYQAQLQVVPPSTSTRLGNAAVEGYRSMIDGVVSLALFLLSNGPSLLLWGAILFFPARMLWKKLRRSFAA